MENRHLASSSSKPNHVNQRHGIVSGAGISLTQSPTSNVSTGKHPMVQVLDESRLFSMQVREQLGRGDSTPLGAHALPSSDIPNPSHPTEEVVAIRSGGLSVRRNQSVHLSSSSSSSSPANKLVVRAITTEELKTSDILYNRSAWKRFAFNNPNHNTNNDHQ